MDSILSALAIDKATKKPKATCIVPPCKNGRQLAISDVHGCFRTFDALLNKVELTRNDHLFLLGDFISRGPNSGMVLDKVMELQSTGYQVLALRGNHEQMVLDCLDQRPFALTGVLQRLNAHGLINAYGQIKPQYDELMRSLYYYFELDDYFLVHAGFNFNARKPLKDREAMLTIRDFGYDPKVMKGKPVVHGHDRTSLKTIRKRLERGANVLPIDNGCWNARNISGHGKLVCLNLSSREITTQKNLDYAGKRARLTKTG